MTHFGWVFTINNPGDKDPASWPGYKYLIYQEEIGEQGTQHIQGYVVWSRQKRLSGCRKVHDTAHWEPRRGTHEQAKAYCMKEDTRIAGPFEFGEEPTGQGARTDIRDLFKAVVEDNTPNTILWKEHTVPMAKYYKAVTQCRNELMQERGKKAFDSRFDLPLNEWQTRELNRLLQQDENKITWIWEEEGGFGKSHLAGHLIANHNAFECFTNKHSKPSDVAYIYNYQEIVVVDLTKKESEGVVDYMLLEHFKNGKLFSPKYESTIKYFMPCKVIVFANYPPDLSGLTDRRWDVVHLQPHEKVVYPN